MRAVSELSRGRRIDDESCAMEGDAHRAESCVRPQRCRRSDIGPHSEILSNPTSSFDEEVHLRRAIVGSGWPFGNHPGEPCGHERLP
jgi:hypothetical protein